jgi:hypothetical protein
VNEAFPPVLVVTPPASPSGSPLRTRAPLPQPSPTSVPVTVAPRTAVRLASGPLHGIDHHARGTVALYAVGDEVRLRFEAVAIEGTPTPSVHLVTPGRRSPTGGTRLGGLKAEKGSFSYAVPGALDPQRGWSVLVWCDRYAVPIAAADLRG